MQDYSLSFTAASLMSFETEQVALLFLQHKDWKVVKNLIVDDNILQKGTISTRKREFTEIKKRLNDISDDDLKFISNCTTDELKLYCLFLCSKTYRLIFEFISEAIRDKYLMFDYSILDSDYVRFIESKMMNSKKLQKITENTEYKIKQVIFRILEQSTLIDSAKSKNIQKPYISEELEKVITKNNPVFLSSFLYTNSDIQKIQEDLNG